MPKKRDRKGRNGRSNNRSSDNSHPERPREEPSASKKDDLKVLFVFVIILTAIIGSYYVYDRSLGDDQNNDDTLNLDDNLNDGDHLDDNNDNNGGNSDNGFNNFQRTVLIEAFTSVDCYWCNLEEEPALQRLVQDYSRDQVIIVAYHGYYGDDPYETEKVTQRGNYYGGISGTPNVWVDGTLNKVGGTGEGVDAMYNIFDDFIKQRAVLPSSFSIQLTASISSSQMIVKADIDNSAGFDATYYKIRFAVTEDELSAKGKSYDWVMRDVVEQSLSGKSFPTQVQQSFDIDPGWDHGNLNIVAWIQDDRSGEVSEAAHFSLNG